MTLNEASLQGKYDLIKLAVHTSTQISSRTSAVIAKFLPSRHGTENSAPTMTGDNNNINNGQPVIVALTAKPSATNKLISIVEIAKRDLAERRVKCFQYNALGSEIVDVERKSKETADDEGESDDAFETMGAVPLSEKKKRSLPFMTVYLAETSVRELKLLYGEQT